MVYDAFVHSREAPISYAAERAFALRLADLADAISLRAYEGTFGVRLKPDGSPVTDADVAIEAGIRESLARSYPSDRVLGEEGGSGGPDSSPRTWVIDPIDGTKNFTAGIPIWGTLIALVENGEPVVGVASAPAWESATSQYGAKGPRSTENRSMSRGKDRSRARP